MKHYIIIKTACGKSYNNIENAYNHYYIKNKESKFLKYIFYFR